MRINSDEKYVIDLVADVLKEEYEGKNRVGTLLGDQGKRGQRSKLPVDAYLPASNIILEYKEKQYFQAVRIMDKRMTVSPQHRRSAGDCEYLQRLLTRRGLMKK